MSHKRRHVLTATGLMLMGVAFLSYGEVGFASIMILLGSFALIPVVDPDSQHEQPTNHILGEGDE